jgi:hypothetical protein
MDNDIKSNQDKHNNINIYLYMDTGTDHDIHAYGNANKN